MAVGLRMPLVRLEPAPVPPVPPVPPAGQVLPQQPQSLRRTLDLDPSRGLVRWASTVRDAAEGVLLVDLDGRVVAASPWGCTLLRSSPDRAVGTLLVELLQVVDFTAAALPVPDAAEQLPPLRVLRGGGPMARTLVRLRCEGELVTLDVVGVAVQGGALAFLSEV